MMVNLSQILTKKMVFVLKILPAYQKNKQGKIWFGSTQFDEVGKKEGCVTIFDGKAFKRFSMDKLTNTSVWSIYEDKSANIWLGMRNAQLYRYNGKDFIKPLFRKLNCLSLFFYKRDYLFAAHYYRDRN